MTAVRWWALVGPVTTPTSTGLILDPFDQARTLDATYHVGPLRVRAGDRPLVEFVRSEPLSLDGRTTFESRPLIVEGPGAANRFDRANTRLLHRLACLLSLAWREPWNVRSVPISTDAVPPSVPESWSSLHPWKTAEPRLADDPQPMPDLVGRAWKPLGRSPRMRSALTTWHQGVLTRNSHTSLSLLAFTAATEAVGKSRWARQRFDEPARGAKDRFRKTAALVADSKDLAMIDEVYTRRSSFVHEGVTHATEGFYGVLFDLPPGAAHAIYEDEAAHFALRVVGTMQRVSGDLVAAALVH